MSQRMYTQLTNVVYFRKENVSIAVTYFESHVAKQI